jgi:hypothetical protein
VLVSDRLNKIPVTLVFTTGFDPFQVLINLSTKSPATHAALGVGDHLLHAYEPGVMLEPREEWLGKQEQRLVAEFQILPDVTYGVEQAMTHVGKKYDVAHVFKIGLLRLLRPALWSLGPDAADKFTCARFVTTIDPYGELIPEWRDLWHEALVPADLLDAALTGPSFLRVA